MAIRTAPIRILAADDHTLLRTALCQLLDAEEDMKVVAQTGSGTALPELVAAHRPDVVLLDVEMPGSHPQTMSRTLLTRFPWMRLIILSMYDGPPLVQELLALGVRGYLHKSVSRESLVSTIRTAARDDQQVTVSVSRTSLSALTADPAVSAARLSSRELGVLEHVANALSNRQIAALLGITEGTVKRHLRNIFDKLGAVSRIDAVNKAVAAELINPPVVPPQRSPVLERL
ncbi:response regulator transcription factor [Kitasatospora atroaurantiaca]|uniref:LuxR family two component transcriptional regulator n=1 Tax=Kitasatospora atroaurantiaca TaxID=285545 RepID=A0A561ENP6_9ACTN|nr:response regulator transcription factor [Kitasatospora atroaurantiaca]TWE17235.1 LuxR family two component transcriptional regulator [Kitasatospora atroaurantiaca]